MAEDEVIVDPLSLPEEVISQGLELCPLKTRAEIEEEFSEWLTNIGEPESNEDLIRKFFFFCRIKGEAINV